MNWNNLSSERICIYSRFFEEISEKTLRENYHRGNYHRIRENYHRVPRIREIGSLQVHTGYLTFSLKKLIYSNRQTITVFFVLKLKNKEDAKKN